MTIERTYPAGWGIGEKLLSSQVNAMDVALTYALDKRAGYSDTLQSIVHCADAGRVIKTIATGPDADTSWTAGGGNQIIRIPTLTAARSYTLGNSGATTGDRIMAYVEGTGSTASGYVDVKNALGTGLFRLGMVRTGTGMSEQAEGDAAEFVFAEGAWRLLRGAGAGLRSILFTSFAIWICPPGVHKILVFGCGGGGGGGGGRPNSTAGNRWVSGGGGGGGAEYKCMVVDVVPGRAYEIYVGEGGAGGVAGDSGDPGGSSGIYDPILGDYICFFRGGQGGRTQVTTFGISSLGIYRAHGGSPVAFPNRAGWGNFADDIVIDAVPSGVTSFGFPLPAGTGGAGNGTGDGVVGSPNSFGSFSGGSGGVKGTDSGIERGGGGGGGGGAGPFGPGGAGGAGGNGGTPTAGSAGSAAPANSGGGGGGGGSGGTAGAGSGAGGAGGAGGSGRFHIAFVK